MTKIFKHQCSFARIIAIGRCLHSSSAIPLHRPSLYRPEIYCTGWYVSMRVHIYLNVIQFGLIAACMTDRLAPTDLREMCVWTEEAAHTHTHTYTRITDLLHWFRIHTYYSKALRSETSLFDFDKRVLQKTYKFRGVSLPTCRRYHYLQAESILFTK